MAESIRKFQNHKHIYFAAEPGILNDFGLEYQCGCKVLIARPQSLLRSMGCTKCSLVQ